MIYKKYNHLNDFADDGVLITYEAKRKLNSDQFIISMEPVYTTVYCPKNFLLEEL